ncbi:unnamed protein product [Cylindrotheca closterium]|uniref:RNA helicase n=1 Tax=Cylindrotheca closterium TaxID=2856 RepID=A0AAD2CN43_9STRA|nr:unnamed protein product [Cylindrotheca closterium]
MSSRKGETGRRKGSEKHGYVKTKNGFKFIGGAAAVRAAAVRKGRGNRILKPGEVEKAQQLVSGGLSPFERFFAGLLKGEATDFLNKGGTATWNSICKRLRLPFPEEPLKHYYCDQRQHFLHRASLVMEEARYALAEGLTKVQRLSSDEERFKRSQNNRNRRHQRHGNGSQSNTMLLSLTGVEVREKHGYCTLTFAKDRGTFSPKEIQNLRQGQIFACVSQNLAPTIANSVLGCILASNRDAMIDSNSFSVVVFKAVSKSQESTWRVTPVASLLTEQRKFEACVNNNTHNIPFLLPLLGGKKPTHIKFTEEETGDILAVKVEDEENQQPLYSRTELNQAGFHLPTLNPTQEKAALTFLNSQPNTITLIQGPPGTGKTTLLVNTICQYLMESIAGNKARCLMVCAPTNKAVSVLCTRFLDTFKNINQLPCNVLLIGDDDKLLDDENSRNFRCGGKSPLRSIFLYTWIKTVVDRLSEISQFLARPTAKEALRVTSLSKRLLMQLRQNLSQFPQDLGKAFDRVVELMEDGIEAGHRNQKEAFNTIEAMKSEILDWKQDLIWQDLLSSAHIIFCTLASSGAGILKRSIGEVDDLIVDEAAASCEPEMYIPFHFRPQRLLAVGDPRQLPATVMSNIAADRGLSKSLHERLMYDAGYPHIMLDVQYRMKPAISQFPSKFFYDGKVRDSPSVMSDDCPPDLLLNGENLSFLQVSGTEKQCRFGSFENYAEAQAVVKLVQSASRRMHGQWQSADRIRIITFYTAQVLLIKRCLRQCRLSDVVVATVDSSQGSEADIVIVSLVRSHGSPKHSSVGFLSDDRRMNVAITRAKYQLICVGNAERMAALTSPKAKTIRALAIDAIDRNCLLRSMHTRNSGPNKRQRADTNNEGREKRVRSRESIPDNTTKIPLSDSHRVNSNGLIDEDTSAREDDRKQSSEDQHENESKNEKRASGTRLGNPKTREIPNSSNFRNSNDKRSSSGNAVQLRPCSASTSSSSSNSSSSSSSDSDLSGQNEIPSIVRSSDVCSPSRSLENISTRSEDRYDNDPFERCSQDEFNDPIAQDSNVGDEETAAIQIEHSSKFSVLETRSLTAESGRSEIPLALDTAMVMSDDSASYGDNRSELEWNSDEVGGNNESRTNMDIGNNRDAN